MSEISLYDTRKNSTFTIKHNSSIKMYVCGPTVYDSAHAGHLKTYMHYDIIRRIFEHFGVHVQFMMNITNVDDKIIKRTYQTEYNLPDNFNLNNLKEEQYLSNKKFDAFADLWEKHFFEVMDMMNIKKPNIVSRVTEYIDEIFDFVDEIYKRGYAFEDNGSVYFYGTKYNDEHSKDPNHELNFSLLKKVRPYEPGWPSKWGLVRPSWHIECSVLISNVFGEKFDIHGGGIDLKFPHHHNEILQSNARFGYNDTSEEWVSHFCHTGHLNIDGQKMSKSLKNFITVNEIMERYTHDQMRMLFLLHRWCDPMDYSEETMKHAVHFADIFNNFFIQMRSILLRPNVKENKKYSSLEINMSDNLIKAAININTKLMDNVDTPSVIKILHTLTSDLFKYVSEIDVSSGMISKEIITDYVNYIQKILSMFGLIGNQSEDKNDSNNGMENKLLKVIQDIRTELRDVAKNIVTKVKPLDKNLATELQQSIYQLTDRLRNETLPSIGVNLTDK